jgi:hypothetical protein
MPLLLLLLLLLLGGACVIPAVARLRLHGDWQSWLKHLSSRWVASTFELCKSSTETARQYIPGESTNYMYISGRRETPA